MGIIAKIGPLELSLILFFAVLLLYRLRAAPESRVATALVFIFSARFGASIVKGFTLSEETKLSFGELDTVFSYTMLAFAFLEVLLLTRVNKWKSSDLWFLLSLLGIGFLNLLWKFAFDAAVSANDLLYVLPILLFLALRPTKVDLRFLPYFGTTIILLVFITALVKYQNPSFQYYQDDYGLGGPYQNRVWDLFGLEERFRGPYFHPNHVGMQITFLSLLALLKPSRFYIAILPFSFTLLFLASSRTSMLALMAGLVLRIYFDATRPAKAKSSHMKQNLLKNYSRGKFVMRKIVFGLAGAAIFIMVVLQIIGDNTTGTGRLTNNLETISAIRGNLLFGQGPSLFSINNTENTIITLASYYGLIGLALFLLLILALALKFRKMAHNEKSPIMIIFTVFLIASTGESLLVGSSMDTGLYYLLVLLALTRRGPIRKDTIPNSAVI
jgi:hypothetical protein